MVKDQEGTNIWRKSVLQKGPKFAVTRKNHPVKEYISTTTLAGVQAGEFNGVDCSGLHYEVIRILNTYTNKPKHTNITKAEHLVLENFRKDKDHSIVIADKGVAPVVMEKNRIYHKI